MNVTKKLLGMALAVLPCALFADGPFAGQADGAVKSVATGVEQQSGSMSLSAEGEAYKTGLGAWSLPWGALGSWELQNLVVKNGSLLIDLDDTTERAAERPNDVLGKALFWFDASFLDDHPDFYGKTEADGKTYLNYMYDVREENLVVASRQRPYAAANHYLRVVKAGLPDGDVNNTEMKWYEPNKMPSPELVTRNGKTAIWFGGVGSGRSMSIIRAGEDAVSTATDVVHVFAVTDSPDGWGAVFSPGFRPTGVWTGTPEYSWQVPIYGQPHVL